MRLVQSGARLIPSQATPYLADVVLDVVRQDPAPGAAVLQGLFFGRTAPPMSEQSQSPCLPGSPTVVSRPAAITIRTDGAN